MAQSTMNDIDKGHNFYIMSILIVCALIALP